MFRFQPSSVSPAARLAALVTRRGRALAATAVVLATVGAAVAPAAQPAAAATPATTLTALNLRAGPSLGDWVALVMPQGSSVAVDGDPANGFFPVTYGRTSGWAFGAYLAQNGAPAPKAAAAAGTATTTTALNLRGGPSTADAILAVMPAGAGVALTGDAANGFSGVTYNGLTGWAYDAYLRQGGTAAAAAPAPAPAPVLSETDQILQYIYDAAALYGQDASAMVRVAGCESGYNTYAVGRLGELGIFQFMPSTWATTPFAGYDPFNAWANANAAAWMWSVGRRGEWVCQ